MVQPKYAIHPGYVVSVHDSDLHYIGIAQLARLYNLGPGEYIVWDSQHPETFLGRNWYDYTHLYPQHHASAYDEMRLRIADQRDREHTSREKGI